jgi:hypothetical protein
MSSSRINGAFDVQSWSRSHRSCEPVVKSCVGQTTDLKATFTSSRLVRTATNGFHEWWTHSHDFTTAHRTHHKATALFSHLNDTIGKSGSNILAIWGELYTHHFTVTFTARRILNVRKSLSTRYTYTVDSRYYDTYGIRKMYQYNQTIDITSLNFYWLGMVGIQIWYRNKHTVVP